MILRVQVWVTYFANRGIDMNKREQRARVYMAANVLSAFVVGLGLAYWCGYLYGSSICI